MVPVNEVTLTFLKDLARLALMSNLTMTTWDNKLL